MSIKGITIWWSTGFVEYKVSFGKNPNELCSFTFALVVFFTASFIGFI